MLINSQVFFNQDDANPPFNKYYIWYVGLEATTYKILLIYKTKWSLKEDSLRKICANAFKLRE